MSEIENIPGWREAIEEERSNRESPFLGITETLAGGFEVRQITLRDYLRLRGVQNPVLLGAKRVSPEALAAFLWLLHPEYHPKGGKTKNRFMRRKCRHFFPPDLPLLPTERAVRRWKRKARARFYNFSATLKSAREFVVRTFMDRPVNELTEGMHVPEYFSDAAFFCALFAREYNGWTPDTVMSLPLAVVFQLLNEIKQKNLPYPILFNPLSDRIISAHLRQLNEGARN